MDTRMPSLVIQGTTTHLVERQWFVEAVDLLLEKRKGRWRHDAKVERAEHVRLDLEDLWPRPLVRSMAQTDKRRTV